MNYVIKCDGNTVAVLPQGITRRELERELVAVKKLHGADRKYEILESEDRTGDVGLKFTPTSETYEPDTIVRIDRESVGLTPDGEPARIVETVVRKRVDSWGMSITVECLKDGARRIIEVVSL